MVDVDLPAVASNGQFNLPLYSEARAMIERVARVDEAKSIADRATALRSYATRAKDRELAVFATEIRMRAERKAGELLIDSKLHNRRNAIGRRPTLVETLGNGSNQEPFKLPSLEELGVTKKESMLWQRVARQPEDVFETRIARMHNPGFGPLFSSDSDEWLTPKHVLDAVVSCLGGIDLDPCAAHQEPENVPAETRITKNGDGLAHPWSGNVFLNPPYGDVVDFWCEKLVREWQQGCVDSAIALVAARTDTRWFRMFRFAPVCFIAGRLKFRRPGKPAEELSAPFPSAAFYLGQDKQKFIRAFMQLGEIRDSAIAG